MNVINRSCLTRAGGCKLQKESLQAAPAVPYKSVEKQCFLNL